MKQLFNLIGLCLLILVSCKGSKQLQPVITADFQEFIEATGYITDTEKFGWSIVQKTISKYDVVDGVDWKKPDGVTPAKMDLPVTQVSYNDAMAYCQWVEASLPSYGSYWKLIQFDKRRVNSNTFAILPVAETNLLGNTWDITKTWNNRNKIRLAGGSYLCSVTSCNRTDIDRRLHVSPNTGNTHISFSVVVD